MTVMRPVDNDITEKPSVDEALNAIAEDFAKFRKDFDGLKSDVAALGAASAEEVETKLRRGAETAQADMRSAINDAESELDDIRRQAEKAVRKNPITAVAAALALGYFASGLMRK